MPLVTRFANQGNFFKQDTEPADWQEGDLWSDTTNDLLFINVGGVATAIGSSAFEILDNYEATSEEASHIKSGLSISFDDTSEIIVTGTLECIAQFNVSLKINGQASGYNWTISTLGTSGLSTSTDPSDPNGRMFTTGAGNAATFFIVHINLNDTDRAHWHGMANLSNNTEVFSGSNNSINSGDLTSIEILADSNWKVGSKITMYQVKRSV